LILKNFKKKFKADYLIYTDKYGLKSQKYEIAGAFKIKN